MIFLWLFSGLVQAVKMGGLAEARVNCLLPECGAWFRLVSFAFQGLLVLRGDF